MYEAEETLDTYTEPLDTEDLDGYNDELDAAASDAEADPLKMLMNAVPGVPGEDYPIFPLPPDTSFLCEVQPVEGYYADPEADCQLYHVCSDSGDGKYVKFDFLCPNGTVFNQESWPLPSSCNYILMIGGVCL